MKVQNLFKHSFITLKVIKSYCALTHYYMIYGGLSLKEIFKQLLNPLEGGCGWKKYYYPHPHPPSQPTTTCLSSIITPSDDFRREMCSMLLSTSEFFFYSYVSAHTFFNTLTSHDKIKYTTTLLTFLFSFICFLWNILEEEEITIASFNTVTYTTCYKSK
jgi:hypothetical protein